MSYHENLKHCGNEWIASNFALPNPPNVASDEDSICNALRFMNFQYSYADIAQDLENIFNHHSSLRECSKNLYGNENLYLSQRGLFTQSKRNTLFLHFVTKENFLNTVGNGEKEFRNQYIKKFKNKQINNYFTTYLTKRIERQRVLWLAENTTEGVTEDAVIKTAKELGLFHFGLLKFEDPVIVFLLRANKAFNLIKPTWVHAFPNWYWDPAPEGETESAHGWARCLLTGQLLRKEWVLHPTEMQDAFTVEAFYQSHDEELETPSIDFEKLGDKYWPTVQARYRQLHARANI